VIENLAALQEIDRRNHLRELELADIERETAAQQALLDEKRSTAESLRTEFATQSERRQTLEAQLAAEEQRMKERRMRLGRLRNDKEVSALQREIEVAKEANSRLEEEVYALIEQVEALEGSAKLADDERRAVEESLAKLGETGTGRSQVLRAEIESEIGERNAIAARLGESIRKKYEQLFRRRNGIAVVEARGGSCRGCNMHLPPQLVIRVQRRIEIEYCPNCQRILYTRPGSADGAEADGG
jgi:predicted  nucleic acid-binding Zn-ribbon protein